MLATTPQFAEGTPPPLSLSLMLKTETGGWLKIYANRRECTQCSLQKTEDETHVTLECPAYAHIRALTFNSLPMDASVLRNWHILSQYPRTPHTTHGKDKRYHIPPTPARGACF